MSQEIHLKLIHSERMGSGCDDYDSRVEASSVPVDDQSEYVGRLFEQYQHSLLRYLIRLTGNENDAKELLQETYLRMVRHKNLDRVEARVRSLLFSTALNLVRDNVRRNTRRHSFSHDSLEDHDDLVDGVSPEQRAEWSEHLEALQIAIGELPQRARAIFVLHRFRHMSYPEIADSMGVTTRTVERQMATAMSYLKSRFRDVL